MIIHTSMCMMSKNQKQRSDTMVTGKSKPVKQKEWSEERQIKYYEKRLLKVKKMHKYNKSDTQLKKDKCNEYISFAEKQLQKAKNSRKQNNSKRKK